MILHRFAVGAIVLVCAAIRAWGDEHDLSPEEVQRLTVSAQGGDAHAQVELGKAYMYGRGLRKNPKEAVRLFQMAVQQGSPAGQTALGEAYRFGDGVRKDYQEAVKLFRAAAEQGYPPGLVALSVMYYRGLGIEKDKSKASQLNRNAAEQGYEYAYFNLAEEYCIGNILSSDRSECYKWSLLAYKATGRQLAAEYASNARKVLTDAQAAQIEGWVQAWLTERDGKWKDMQKW